MLTISALVSLDGVQGEPRSWASEYFDEAAAGRALTALRAADAMLMGRRTYEYFAPAWPQASGPYADRVNEITKYVFSDTLTRADWTGAKLVRGDAVPAVRALKEQASGDLVMYGFGRLGHALLAAGLVDALDLAVHPVVLGDGEQVVRPGSRAGLRLAEVERLAGGVVSLTYTPATPVTRR
jgi:dihydrofolate reductase